MRDTLCIYTSFISPSLSTLASTTLLDFMRRTAWRYELKNICVTYVSTVKRIQKSYRGLLEHNGRKYGMFLNTWKREAAIMIRELYVSDNKEDMDMFKVLEGFEINSKKCILRSKLITTFITRCTIVHALVYLQYRKRLPDIKNDQMAQTELTEMFSERQEYLLKVLSTAEILIKADIAERVQKEKNSQQSDEGSNSGLTENITLSIEELSDQETSKCEEIEVEKSDEGEKTQEAVEAPEIPENEGETVSKE
jgi:hypothetical protein